MLGETSAMKRRFFYETHFPNFGSPADPTAGWLRQRTCTTCPRGHHPTPFSLASFAKARASAPISRVRTNVSQGIAYSLKGSDIATPIRLLPISKAIALLLTIFLLYHKAERLTNFFHFFPHLFRNIFTYCRYKIP